MPALFGPFLIKFENPGSFFSKVTYLDFIIATFLQRFLFALQKVQVLIGDQNPLLPHHRRIPTGQLRADVAPRDWTKKESREANVGTNPASVLRPGLHTLQSDSRHVLGQFLAESGGCPCPGKDSPVVFTKSRTRSRSENLQQKCENKKTEVRNQMESVFPPQICSEEKLPTFLWISSAQLRKMNEVKLSDQFKTELSHVYEGFETIKSTYFSSSQTSNQSSKCGALNHLSLKKTLI